MKKSLKITLYVLGGLVAAVILWQYLIPMALNLMRDEERGSIYTLVIIIVIVEIIHSFFRQQKK